jgi:flagellar hook-associated protein FlgK
LLDERDRIASQLQELIGGTTLINEDGTASYLIQGQHLVDRQIANQFTNSSGTAPVRADQGPNDIRLKVATSPGIKPTLVQLGFPESVSDAGTVNAKIIPALSAFKDGQAGAYNHLIQTFVPTLQMSLNLISMQLVKQANAVKPIFGFSGLNDANQVNKSLDPIDATILDRFEGWLGASNCLSIKDVGEGYVAGSYQNIQLTAANGSGAIVNVNVNAQGKISSVELVKAGGGYDIGDELQFALPGSTPSKVAKLSVDRLSNAFSAMMDATNPASREFSPEVKKRLLQAPVSATLFQSALQLTDLDGVSTTVGPAIENLRQTFTDPLTFITSSVATTIATWKNDHKANDAMSQILSDQKNAVSGVNLDEEAANLVKYQQLYNASSKLIQTGRQMFDTLLAMMSGN